jgi:small ligand-binding sensory domain FIST
MPRAGVGLSTSPDPVEAAEQAAAAALEGAGRPVVALVFATPGYGEGLRRLLEVARGALGTSAVVGATAHGVFGQGREVEGGTGVSILALEGIEAHPFFVPDAGHEDSDPVGAIAGRLGRPGRSEDLVILLPDPRALGAETLLEDVAEAAGGALVVGAGAADMVSAPPLQWCGDEIESGAVAGLVLCPSQRPRVGVTQACRPVTPPLRVTRASGPWLLELDGRPALDVYREIAREPLADDLRRAAASVLVALPCDAAVGLEPGRYLVRHVAGFAPERGAIAVPALLSTGDRIALARREPETAREDLLDMLQRLEGAPPAFGLYFDCCARGSSFFGVSGLEAGYLERAFGPAPLVGMFGSCEIGPIADRTELLTYTGVLALVDA